MSIRSLDTFFYHLFFLIALLILPVRSQGLQTLQAQALAGMGNPVISGELGGMQVVVQGAFIAFMAAKTWHGATLDATLDPDACAKDLHCTMQKNNTGAVVVEPEGVWVFDKAEPTKDIEKIVSGEPLLPSFLPSNNGLPFKPANTPAITFIPTEANLPATTLATLNTGYPVIDKTPAIELFNSATLQWLSELVEWFGIRPSKHGQDEDEGLSFECETTTTEESRMLTRIYDEYSVRTSLLTSGSPLPTPQITRIEEKEGCVQMMSDTDILTICPSSSSRYQTAGSHTVSMRQVPKGSGSTIENSPSDQAGATPMGVVENNASTDTDEPMSIEATVNPVSAGARANLRKRGYSERDKDIPELAKELGRLSLEEGLPNYISRLAEELGRLSLEEELPNYMSRLAEELGRPSFEEVVSVCFEYEGTFKPCERARAGRFSQDKTHFVAFMSLSGNVFFRSIDGKWERKDFVDHRHITDACFSPDNNYLVSISEVDGVAKISKVAESSLVSLVSPVKAVIVNKEKLIGAHFSLGGTQLVIFGYDRKARIWELAGEEWLETAILKHKDWVENARFSSDETRLVTASMEFAVIWRRTDGVWLKESTLKHPGGGLLTDVRFSPDGIHLVTSTWSGKSAKIWKFVDGKWLLRNTMKIYCSPTMCVRFSPDNTHLVIGGEYANILELVDGEWQEKQIWREYSILHCPPDAAGLAPFPPKRRLNGKMEMAPAILVVNAQFSTDGTCLAICYRDKILTLGLVGGEWQQIGSAIVYPDGGVKDAHFNHDCSQLLVDTEPGGHYDIWRLKIKPKRTK